MKNKFLFFIILFLFIKIEFVLASDLNVSASKIQLDDKSKIIFLNGNVVAIDKNNNRLSTDTAKYNKKMEDYLLLERLKLPLQKITRSWAQIFYSMTKIK